MNPKFSDAPSSLQIQGGGRRGLECPKCGCGHFAVIYTRPVRDNRLMRRRECRHCGRRITTYETSIG